MVLSEILILFKIAKSFYVLMFTLNLFDFVYSSSLYLFTQENANFILYYILAIYICNMSIVGSPKTMSISTEAIQLLQRKSTIII